MKKKILFLLISVLVCFSFYSLIELYVSPRSMKDSKCCFCDQKIIDYQKFYEDDLVLGLYTHKPVTQGHCLIIPKRHVENFEDLSEKEDIAINSLIRRTHNALKTVFNAKSYIILQKNGSEVGQSVPHVHFHYIPRKKDAKNILGFLARFLVNPFLSPISSEEMKEMKEKIRFAFE